MMPEWDEDWESFSTAERVVGTQYENHYTNFILIGDHPDFRIYLERDPHNPHDKNAIKVMGFVPTRDSQSVRQLGFLSRKTARRLKNAGEIDARPYSITLPAKNLRYSLKIWVLVMSEAYRKIAGLPIGTGSGKGGLAKRNVRKVMCNDVYDYLNDSRKEFGCKKVPKRMFKKVFDEFFEEILEEQEISEEELKVEEDTYVFSLCDDLIDVLEDIVDRLFEIMPELERK